MRQVGSVVAMSLLFFIGLLVGAWQFVAPWVIGFEQHWSRTTWSLVWTAAVVMAVSGVALVIVSAVSVRSALRFGERLQAARAAEDDGQDREATPAPVR
jgi:hypothetical protein